MTKKNKIEIQALSGNVHRLIFDDVRQGWEQWVLLSGDRHHDNAHTDQELEIAHLEECRKRNGIILDVGDLFCLMQGKYDPRSSRDDLRPEHKTDRYLDAVLDTSETFYKKYADMFKVIGRGNHDSNILSRLGTDMISNFVDRLRRQGSDCYAGGYGGWVTFQFNIQKTVRQQVNAKYFHGSGGGGPVTRGVIQTNRQAVYLPDADMVINGHTHDQYIMPIARERLTQTGVIKNDCCWYIRTGTYKDEYRDGSGGWHVERGGAPKPLGAVWLRLFFDRDSQVNFEFTGTVKR